MKQSISVILPVYNQEKYLVETIESVLTQTFQDFEFLILDDGSTDDSAHIIREYAKKDKRIVPFFESNSGRCNATNKLVNLAKGKWCAFLDADDVMLPNRLEMQIAFHLANPEIDASSCNCYYINKDSKILGEQRHPCPKTIEDCKRIFISKKLIQCAITGLFISREVFLKVKGLNPKFWPCDDFEFFNRLIDEKYIIVILQETLMKYRIHSSSITVKKPLHTYDVIGYVMECIELRREGKSEITFDQFMAVRANDFWWIKLNRRRFNYAQIFFRNAGINLMSKKYWLFSWQILMSTLLSPSHILNKALNLSKK